MREIVKFFGGPLHGTIEKVEKSVHHIEVPLINSDTYTDDEFPTAPVSYGMYSRVHNIKGHCNKEFEWIGSLKK